MKSWTRILVASTLGVGLSVGCGLVKVPAPSPSPSNSVPISSSKSTFEIPITPSTQVEITQSLSCGSRNGNVDFRVTTPENWNGSLFAVLLNFTPGTTYFSETEDWIRDSLPRLGEPMASHIELGLSQFADPFQVTLEGLKAYGYKVVEVRYHVNPRPCRPLREGAEGFYSLCCHQGLDAVKAHNDSLYETAIENLGFDPQNSEHRLVGFGISLGGTQLVSMAFDSGKKFEKVGIAGVLAGNSVEGCVQGRTRNYTGMGWHDFMPYADSLTTTGDGCSNPARMEYRSFQHNFRYLSHRNRWDLKMFEGGRRTHLQPFSDLSDTIGLHGNDAQVNYILQSRAAVDTRVNGTQVSAAHPEATAHQIYPGCGHDVMFCTQGEVAQDILSYLDPTRRGRDIQP